MSETGMVQQMRVASAWTVIKDVRAPKVRSGPFFDRLAGLMDGLRGLPDVQTPEATARLARIERWAGVQSGRMASHYGPLLTEVQGAREQLAIQQDLQALRLEQARSALALLIKSGPESGRYFGEADLPEPLIRTRRRREHERTLERLRAAVVSVEDELAATEQATSACTSAAAALQQRWDGDVARIVALAGRRRAKYVAGVSHSHPDRAAVVAAFGPPHANREFEQLHLVTTEESA